MAARISRQTMFLLIALLSATIGLSTFGCAQKTPRPIPAGVDGTDSVVSDEPIVFTTSSAIPAKLDLLFVVDNTPGMCQEQAALVRSFESFVSQLDGYMNVDIRVAVTTTDVLMGQGRFSDEAATKFPNACAETQLLPCLTNDECVDAFGSGWICHQPPIIDGDPAFHNGNLSLNSLCAFTCDSDEECCEYFCYVDECGDDMTCVSDMCGDPEGACTQTCVAHGGGSEALKNCVAQPDVRMCFFSDIPPVLTQDSLGYFPCIAFVGADQSFTAGLESGIKTAWMALDPDGLQAEQSAAFLRDDAYLLIVFLSDEDDCSIDEDFCSPSFGCDDDNDCPGYTQCKDGLCCGVVKKDYYNICALLGEYKGEDHHACAYDAACQDCKSDADCDEGWYCKSDKKCRPYIYGFNTIATFQQPAGTPLFALAPVSDFYDQFRSLKSDPDKVLVAAFVGDALVQGNDEDSLISEECFLDEKLGRCQDYQLKKATATVECLDDPYLDGCEDLLQAKIECARQCYIASKGDNKIPQAKNSYICAGDMGTADFGSRYLRLAGMFGANGLANSLCRSSGLGPSLDMTAELLLKRLTRICLPFPVKEGAQVEVTRRLPGAEPVVLVEGAAPDGDFQVVYPESVCCDPDAQGQCTGSETALMFTDVLDPAAKISVNYVVASRDNSR